MNSELFQVQTTGEGAGEGGKKGGGELGMRSFLRAGYWALSLQRRFGRDLILLVTRYREEYHERFLKMRMIPFIWNMIDA